MSQRVTSVDVARHAGVSQSTVSLVLGGKARGRVSEATAVRVREAARALGYRPNHAAQALRRGSARTICLVVPDVTNPIFGRILRGTQSAARGAGYAVALIDTERDRTWADEAFASLAAGPVDGFLLFGLAPSPGVDVSGEAIVLIETEAPGLPSVRFATADGMRAALRLLIGLGHRRIGHVAANVDQTTFVVRIRAADALLADAGLPPAQRARAAVSHQAARVAALELLDAPRRPTAIVCDDDIMAAGVYLAARELELEIPGDLSVVGFDDLDVATILAPPLTTLITDAERIGAVAFELLAMVMRGGPRPRRRTLPVELVVRGSTGPAPRRRR